MSCPGYGLQEPTPWELGIVVGLSTSDLMDPPPEWEPWIEGRECAPPAAAAAAVYVRGCEHVCVVDKLAVHDSCTSTQLDSDGLCVCAVWHLRVDNTYLLGKSIMTISNSLPETLPCRSCTPEAGPEQLQGTWCRA